MKKLMIAILFYLAGCQLTGCGTSSSRPIDSRDVLIAVGTAVVVGAIVANQNDKKPPAHMYPSGCYTIVPPGIIQRRFC